MESTDHLVATVAGALVRMTDWFRIEAHTSRYPEGAYVQVRLDDPELGPDSDLRFEATGPIYLGLSAEQQARMRELGWDGPTDPEWMPSVNYERFVEADAVEPGPLAEFVMTTLREVYGATDDDEYTLSPAALGAEVVPDPDALEFFEVVEPGGRATTDSAAGDRSRHHPGVLGPDAGQRRAAGPDRPPGGCGGVRRRRAVDPPPRGCLGRSDPVTTVRGVAVGLGSVPVGTRPPAPDDDAASTSRESSAVGGGAPPARVRLWLVAARHRLRTQPIRRQEARRGAAVVGVEASARVAGSGAAVRLPGLGVPLSVTT